ncbi:MAG: hypothetical protein IJQ31_07250 [Thermoguttaceae bacterium]|nr:hypothetical protein [Thermoguttaceae bacterium]
MNQDDAKLKQFQEKFFPYKTLEEIRNLESLKIEVSTYLDDEEDLKLLSALPKLKTLTLSEIQSVLTPKGVGFLAQIPTLKNLVIRYSDLNREILTAIAAIPGLESFESCIMGCECSDMMAFDGNTHIKSLSVELNPNENTWKKYVPYMPALERLSMTYPVEPDSWHILLEKMPNLREIDYVDGKYRVENGKIVHVTDSEKEEVYEVHREMKHLTIDSSSPVETLDQFMPKLESLTVWDSPKLKWIDFSQMPNLKDLDIWSSDPEFQIEMKDLDSLEMLNTLEFVGLQLQPGILRDLEMDQNLKSVSLNNCQMRREDVRYISSLQYLEELTLGLDDELTAEDLEQLEEMPRLRSLELNGGRALGMVEALLPKLPRIQELKLIDCPFFEDEIGVLEECSRLRSLTITCCLDSTYALKRILSLEKIHKVSLGCRGMETLTIDDCCDVRSLCLAGSDLKEMTLENMRELYQVNLGFESLERLSIKDSPVLHMIGLSDYSLLNHLRLENLPNLDYLDVSYCRNLELVELVGSTKPHSLSVNPEQVRDGLLWKLRKDLPELIRVTVAGKINPINDSENLSEEEEAKLKKDLPEDCFLEIIFTA